MANVNNHLHYSKDLLRKFTWKTIQPLWPKFCGNLNHHQLVPVTWVLQLITSLQNWPISQLHHWKTDQSAMNQALRTTWLTNNSSLDFGNDLCKDYWNVSHYHCQQSFPGLLSPTWTNYMLIRLNNRWKRVAGLLSCFNRVYYRKTLY